MSDARNPREDGQHLGLLIDDGESDGGSSYAESPADGYFRERSHPRDVFVQNPSIEEESKSGETKALMADSAAAGQHSQISSPAASLRSRSYSVESLPLPVLDAGPAPPDYAAATAHRTEPRSMPYHENVWASERSSEDRTTSYGSMDGSRRQSTAASHQIGPNWPFGNTNNPFGPGFPFAAGNHPFGPGFPFNPPPQGTRPGENGPTQSVGQPSEMSDRVQTRDGSLEETVPLRWNRPPQPGRKSWFSRSPCKPKSFVKILIAVAIIIFIIWVARSATGADEARSGTGDEGKAKLPGDHGDHGDSGGSNGHDDPGKPDGDKNAHQPPYTPNPPAPSPTRSPSPSCPVNFRTDTAAFTFQRPDSFFFVEAVERKNDFQGQIRGNVYVRPAQGEQGADIVLYVSVGTTTPWQVTSLDYIQTDNSFLLNMPKLTQSGKTFSKRPCIEINAWIYIREGVSLVDLGLEVTHLNIVIEEGLFNPNPAKSDSSHLHVKSMADFSSVTGDISSAYWSSRDTVVRTTSGDITGRYALLDNLGLYSTSGDIAVGVDPQEVDKEDPSPASLMVETSSGVIDINFPLKDKLPERQYRTQVDTSSGDISGSYIHGRESIFQTTSGDIEVTLLPYCYENNDSALQTSSYSGNTYVTVLSPYGRAGIPWGLMHQSGGATSGDLRLTYPSEWEGRLDLSSMSGDISVKGDVRKIVEDRLRWGRRFVGEKGTGKGALDFKTTSGSMKVTIGQ